MTKNAIALVTDLGALGKMIDGIKRAGAKLDKEIHVAALSSVAHFAKCGDVGYINRLYNAMPKGARHVAMTAWLTQFAGVMANTDEGKKETPFIKDKNKQVDMEGASGTPWYECKPSAAPDQVVDYYALLMKVVTKKAKEGQEVANAALLAKITPILDQYRSDMEANADPDAANETADETVEASAE